MSSYTPLSRERLAQTVAGDLPDGVYVNLGIGMPTTLARWLPKGREIILHSENGILGMGPAGDLVDLDLINASKEQISLLPGAAICDHVVSFTMMRGGHDSSIHSIAVATGSASKRRTNPESTNRWWCQRLSRSPTSRLLGGTRRSRKCSTRLRAASAARSKCYSSSATPASARRP